MGREALEGLSLKLQDFICVQDWKQGAQDRTLPEESVRGGPECTRPEEYAQGWMDMHKAGMLEVHKSGAAPSGGCIVVRRLSPKEAPSSQRR